MLAARQMADGFVGRPAGTVKPLTYLAAFQEAEPYLGLPGAAYKLVAWLVKQTMPCDWEIGSRPIAWPSALRQGEFLGLSPTRVKMLNRMLFEAGIFVIRDNPQGKRYGRRGPDKRIIEAYGFDLSPLAQRYAEFVRIAAAAKTERTRVKAQRQRITIARRGIRQMGELVPSPLPSGWTQIAADAAALVVTARKAERSEDLYPIADTLEALQEQAEVLIKASVPSVEIYPKGSETGPHITSTNLTVHPSDTVIAFEESSRAARAAPPSPSMHQRPERRSVAGIRRPSQLLELMPRLGAYIADQEPSWSEITEAAYSGLRLELGVSASLWAEACRVMGREGAALALAIVSTKPDSFFTKGAGGYFGGMVRKAEKGELFLEKTLWGLRQSRFGGAGRRVN